MKIVLITGGLSGIGEAIAQLLSDSSHKIIILDTQQPTIDCSYLKTDIRKEDEIIRALAQMEHVDVLINSAGVYIPGSVEDTTQEELDRIIDTNFKGTYLMCKHVLPKLKPRQGCIVNISSGIGVVPEIDSPAYCASKAAVNMLTKTLAQKYASQGIRVNAVLPGPIDTPLLRKEFKTTEKLSAYAALNPMKRIGTPEDVAQVVKFLISDEASYITGSLYAVDGGESSSSIYSE